MSSGEGGGGALDPPVRTARTRASWTIVLVGLTAAIALMGLVQQVLRLVEINQLSGTCLFPSDVGCRPVDVPATIAAANALDVRAAAFLIAAVVASLVAGIVWLTWQHRAQTLLDQRLLAPGLRFTPGWAVGWWFVPFANFGKPLVVMAELWRASAGEDGSGRPWRQRALPALFGWWWALWLLQIVPLYATRGPADPEAMTLGEFRVEAVAVILSSAATVGAGVLAIAIVRSIQGRLERATPYGFAPVVAPRGLTERTTAAPLPASTLPWAGPAAAGDASPESVRAGEDAPMTQPQRTWSTDSSAGWPAPPSVETQPQPPVQPPGPAIFRPDPPPWRIVRPVAVVMAAIAVAGTALVLATSPSVRLAEEGVASPEASPSVIVAGPIPDAWEEHGGPEAGFAISTPPNWTETTSGDGLVSINSLRAGITIGHYEVPPEARLEQVAASSIQQLRKDPTLHIEAKPTTSAVTLPAGTSVMVRMYVTVQGESEQFLTFYLLEGGDVWVVNFAGLTVDERIEGLFTRMMAGFRFTP